MKKVSSAFIYHLSADCINVIRYAGNGISIRLCINDLSVPSEDAVDSLFLECGWLGVLSVSSNHIFSYLWRSVLSSHKAGENWLSRADRLTPQHFSRRYQSKSIKHLGSAQSDGQIKCWPRIGNVYLRESLVSFRRCHGKFRFSL